MNNSETSGIHETDLDIFVQFFIKLCTLHFKRPVCVLITLMLSSISITDVPMSWLGPLACKQFSISTNFMHCHHPRILPCGMNSAKGILARNSEVCSSLKMLLQSHTAWFDRPVCPQDQLSMVTARFQQVPLTDAQ